MLRILSGSVQIFYPKFNREELIQAVRERLEDLNKKLPLQLIVLFGSYAKGNYTVASDIDILVVYRGEERKDAYVTVKKTLGVSRLEPHVYSDSQYEKTKKTINKMVKNGIVLFRTWLRGYPKIKWNCKRSFRNKLTYEALDGMDLKGEIGQIRLGEGEVNNGKSKDQD